MGEVQDYDQVDAGNTTDWAEGMARTGVNDSGRAMEGAIRRQFEDPEWHNLLTDGDGWTVSKVSDTVFRVVHNTTPTSATLKFPDGCRVKLTKSTTSVLAIVQSTSFATPNTEVTVIVDSLAAIPTDCDTAETHVTKGSVELTAFSPIGVTLGQTPAQIPSADLLGDSAFKDGGPGGGLDADTLDGAHLADITALITASQSPLVINGSGRYWQRGETLTPSSALFIPNNGTYTADQWVYLQGSGTAHPADSVNDLSLETTIVSDDAATAIKLLANSNISGTSEKFGFVQWFETSRCRHLAGKQVSVSALLRHDGTASHNLVQLAIVEWISTADAIGAGNPDPINDWGAAGVEPTVLANFVINSTVGAGGKVPTTSFARLTLEGITMDSNMKNLGIMVWSDDVSIAVGDALYLAGLAANPGATAQDYVEPDPAIELLRCERYCEKSFPTDVTPAHTTVGGGAFTCTGSGVGGGSGPGARYFWRFRSEKFKTPEMTTYNPVTASATSWRNITDSTDSAVAISDTCKASVNIASVVDLSDENDTLSIHAFAEAKL